MDCCDHCQTSDPERGNSSYRRALSIVLGINAVMFLVEIERLAPRWLRCKPTPSTF